MMEVQLEGRAAEIADEISKEVIDLLMRRFGEEWTADGGNFADVERIRHAFAMPIASGALLAAMRFLWVTAPLDGTRDHLEKTAVSNVRRLLDVVAEDTVPVGDFWRHVDEVARRMGIAP